MKQNILVTGSSSGFGELIVHTLLTKGHNVAASLRDTRGRNKPKAESLKTKGATVIELDVTQEASVTDGVQQAIKALGHLDAVVNNAGIGVLGFIETFTVDDWRRVFDVNVFGVQRVNRAVIPHMRERRSGLLIHISSLLGRMVIPFYGPYNATKFALEALADNYKVELSSFGIESVVVEPGGYPTDFPRNLVKPSDVERITAYGPMADAPARSLAAFEQIFKGPNAPNPQHVADAVAALLEMPRGQRPFRTTVDRLGMGAAVDPLNAMSDEIQKKIYGAFGMAGVLELKVSAGNAA